MPKLTLYHSIQSPFARKVRIAMAEKGITCDKVPIDNQKAESKTPQYLSLNPHGRIPTLVVDGIPVYESTAIIEYLEEAYPTPRLLPKSLLERARVRMIEETIDGYYIPALRTVLFNVFRLPPAERNPKLVEEAKKQINFHVDWVDRELAGRHYLVNGGLTLADIALFVAIEFQRRVEIGIDPRHRNIVDWYERMKSRPSARALME